MSNLGYYRSLIKTCHDLADCAAKPLKFIVPGDDALARGDEHTFQYWIRRRDAAITEYVDLLIKTRSK